MQPIRILDMPPCRMVASTVGMFGEPALEAFGDWLACQPRTLFPQDFLLWDDSDPAHPGFRWLYMYHDGLTLPEGAAVLDFPGGLYAVVTDVDQRTDKTALDAAIGVFLAEYNLVRDPARRELGHIITSAEAHQRLGYDQMDYWYPIA